jgi:hypothetical protein
VSGSIAHGQGDILNHPLGILVEQGSCSMMIRENCFFKIARGPKDCEGPVDLQVWNLQSKRPRLEE